MLCRANLALMDFGSLKFFRVLVFKDNHLLSFKFFFIAYMHYIFCRTLFLGNFQ